MKIKDTDIFICSYPRSGSTYLRFLLCNFFHPDINHNFNTINKLIPTWESDKETKQWDYNTNPRIFKSHTYNYNFNNIIYLVRHVGDVLISQYWYIKKFHGLNENLEEWVKKMNYGENWRKHIEYYTNNRYIINTYKFEDLILNINKNFAKIIDELYFILNLTLNEPIFNILINYYNAIEKCKFEKLQIIEEDNGLGDIYQSESKSNDIKFFRNGSINQWKYLSKEVQNNILNYNELQLKNLKYV